MSQADYFQQEMSRAAANWRDRPPPPEEPEMREFTADLSYLDERQREDAARHVEQTRHLCFGGAELADAAFFRVPASQVRSANPGAVLLGQLAAAVRQGTVKIRPKGLTGQDRFWVSEYLRRSAQRAYESGDLRDQPVAAALAALLRAWDEAAGVSGDEEGRGWKRAGMAPGPVARGPVRVVE